MTAARGKRKIRIIGAPLDLGAGHRGVDMGPSAFRVAGIHQAVRHLGITVEDFGDIEAHVAETRDPGNPQLKYLKEIRATCITLRNVVTRTMDEGVIPVVLGGDHSIAMGTIAGVARHFRRKKEKPGLVWFDAHADANTEHTSPTGNIHGMPMAVCLGLGAKDLLSIYDAKGPMIDGERAAIIGLRSVDLKERANVARVGIGAFTMRHIDERGMRSVMEAAIVRALNGTAGIHVSIDLDAVDPEEAPGVGTPSPGGIGYREMHLALEMLADTERVCSVELVEVNPVLDRANQTAKLGVELLCSLLGKKIL
ncbi:MAG TPA: arginase [Vicinamibacteria bacterium]|nr:arginase [Vicinamibacteria bacterium]